MLFSFIYSQCRTLPVSLPVTLNCFLRLQISGGQPESGNPTSCIYEGQFSIEKGRHLSK